jgi:hypothetical protein
MAVELDTSLQFLTHDLYVTRVQDLGGGHWGNYKERWKYHRWAVRLLQDNPPERAEDVLEIGTMGISIVTGSHTLDYGAKWHFKGFEPTYRRDAKLMPWPIADKHYHTVIALRVFQHLHPAQRECFLEARRVSHNLLIVVPETYEAVGYGNSFGIPEHQFLEWNNGRPADIVVRFANWIGNLYYWSFA